MNPQTHVMTAFEIIKWYFNKKNDIFMRILDF